MPAAGSLPDRGVSSRHRRAAGAGEQAARQRAVGQHADALVETVAAPSPAPPRDRRGGSGSASRRTDASRCVSATCWPARTARRTCSTPRGSAPSGTHDRVQCLHRLLDRGVVVPAVDVVDVDVVGAQPAQRGVDRGQDVPPGQAAVAGCVRHRVVDLGRQHVVLAARRTPRGAGWPVTSSLDAAVVDVGGVVRRHAGLGRAAYQRAGGVDIKVPGAAASVPEAHHPERQPRDLQPAGTTWAYECRSPVHPPAGAARPRARRERCRRARRGSEPGRARRGRTRSRSRAAGRASGRTSTAAAAPSRHWSATYGMTVEETPTPTAHSSQSGCANTGQSPGRSRTGVRDHRTDDHRDGEPVDAVGRALGLPRASWSRRGGPASRTARTRRRWRTAQKRPAALPSRLTRVSSAIPPQPGRAR